MLATWIRDVYRREETADLRRAIDDLASPLDYFAFASNGVYIFFDPYEFRTLYIGLARDLSERFAQHNGLVRMSETGCKKQQVNQWFGEHDELGYAIFVQSSLDQVSVHRQAGAPSAAYYDEESSVFIDYPGDGLDEIKLMEGILISSYFQTLGNLPPWNKIKGAKHAPELATPGGYALLDTAAGSVDSLLVARRTIRGLSADDTALHFEDYLHTGRIGAIEDAMGRGIDTPLILDALLRRANDPHWEVTKLHDVVQEILDAGYLLEPPPIPASASTAGRLRHLPLKHRASQPQQPGGVELDQHAWSPMWTDEGVRLLADMGVEPLLCSQCGDLATIAQGAKDNRSTASWCTVHAADRGAPQTLIDLARR